jgi:TATA-box binding protein (TBP) (component of TFIID and TFIIIB)
MCAQDLASSWAEACRTITDDFRERVPWLGFLQAPNITMMTADLKFVEPIDVRALADHVANDDESLFCAKSEKFAGTAFRYGDSSMNVRVFANGKVHVVGVRSTSELSSMLKDLASAVMLSSGVPDERYMDDDLECVEYVRIPLLNLSIVTNCAFSLGSMHEALVKEGVVSIYGSSCGKKSPGLRVRVSDSTLTFYRSGKIKITASSGKGGNAEAACRTLVAACSSATNVLGIAENAGAVSVGTASLPERTQTARFALFVDGYDVSPGVMNAL